MAKARPVVSDISSEEFDEVRRQFNNLLVIIEGATNLAGIQAAIVAGTDVITGKEINGVKPGPTHPRRRGVVNANRVTLDANSDY